MSQKSDNVVVFPWQNRAIPCLEYTKTESDRLIGRTYVSTDPKDDHVGQIVGTFDCRPGGRLVGFGLQTQYKYLDGGAVQKGTLNRFDLERGCCFVVPQGGVSSRIEKYLTTRRKASQRLLEDLHVEVYAAKATRAYSNGILL